MINKFSRSEWKKKWIEALRSGKYEQGQERLRGTPAKGTTKSTYCCLGVLADVVNPAGWSPPSSVPPFKKDGGFYFNYLEAKSNCELPPRFRKALGISREFQNQLISFNDFGYTFEEIADIIDQTPGEMED